MPTNHGPDRRKDLDTGPTEEDSVYLREYKEDLREFFYRLERTEVVRNAHQELADLNDSGPWNAAEELRLRQAALTIIWQYAVRLLGRSGSLSYEVMLTARQIENCLQSLGRFLNEDAEYLRELEPILEAEGVKLDPTEAGGGQVVQPGRPGRRPTILHDRVKSLLRKRFPDWDGVKPFPHENNQDLRTWISQELQTGWDSPRSSEVFRSSLRWAEARAGMTFDPDEVKDESEGPIWRIIHNLKRDR